MSNKNVILDIWKDSLYALIKSVWDLRSMRLLEEILVHVLISVYHMEDIL